MEFNFSFKEKNYNGDVKVTDFEGAIFDLDGTLLDSMDVWEKIDIEFLSKRGLEVPDDYINNICAFSFKEAAKYTINLFNLDESEEDIINEWNEMAIHEYSNNVKLRPYAKEYLFYLKECGIKLAVATGLPKNLYEPALKNNCVFELFDVFCSTDDGGRGKGYPDVYLRALEKLNMSAEKCISFEDVLQGIINAKEVGLAVYAMYDKYSLKYKEKIIKIADGYLEDFKNAPIPY
ncbi:haloacid dehalogenase superfamily, subfamily IA, variant 3 with third motif having DD or ED [Clostridium cavendishii DSM 21758]|uniref:Haloacid dehalogenase superfamily, subfamily IA, variant 3 with third motif having DD or ED n=1 Tax=Clostridium cavendishii DSM 21758 TaxID=1121302 RepID=A0A1M6HUC3_9CLOT|nr:HAD family phosphatase [Clostridium cavendishii]SHJ25718.1 haloacid dehalogenase superfamily, subfamily IA, variant 3 with third motif having DD or ED [Clostridium cavendishii DSM 21758]